MKTLDAPHFLLGFRLERARVASFDEYPFNLPAIRNLSHLQLHPSVTFLVGENGSGKSTLLEALAVAFGFNPEGGSRNFRFSTRSSHSRLHEYLQLQRGLRRPRDGFFLRAESYFNVATEIESLDLVPGASPPIIASYGGKSLHEQSHGESFLALVTKRFFGNGLYLLDEPEAALSPTRQLALITRMHELVSQNSQFVIATHSPLLLAYPGATIYSLEVDGIRKVAYEDTEHYQITRRFLADHRAMLARLLE
jgi:predicted ATPase